MSLIFRQALIAVAVAVVVAAIADFIKWIGIGAEVYRDGPLSRQGAGFG